MKLESGIFSNIKKENIDSLGEESWKSKKSVDKKFDADNDQSSKSSLDDGTSIIPIDIKREETDGDPIGSMKSDSGSSLESKPSHHVKTIVVKEKVLTLMANPVMVSETYNDQIMIPGKKRKGINRTASGKKEHDSLDGMVAKIMKELKSEKVDDSSYEEDKKDIGNSCSNVILSEEPNGVSIFLTRSDEYSKSPMKSGLLEVKKLNPLAITTNTKINSPAINPHAITRNTNNSAAKDNLSIKNEVHIKKPLNAFMLYMKEMRPVVRAECEEKESAVINQILGRRWHGLTREEQSVFFMKARQERVRHQQLHPNWRCRDNYRLGRKKKFDRMKAAAADPTVNMEKCRRRYGVEQPDLWCKPCKRKRKCVRVLEKAQDTETASDTRVVGRDMDKLSWLNLEQYSPLPQSVKAKFS